MISLKWWISGILIVLHTLLVCMCAGMVWSSDDGETGMIWLLFITIDWPISHVIFDHGAPEGVGFLSRLLILGAVQWGIVGLTCYSFLRLVSAKSHDGDEKK